MNTWQKIVTGILICLCIYAAWRFTPARMTYVKVPGPTIEVEKKIYIRVPQVVTIRVPKVEKGITPVQHVTAIGEVAPSNSSTTVAAIIDEVTGESTLVMKQEALRFIDFENIKEIGVRAGLGTDGFEYSLYGRWSFLRIGSTHLSMTVDSGKAAGFLELSYRW